MPDTQWQTEIIEYATERRDRPLTASERDQFTALSMFTDMRDIYALIDSFQS